MTNHFDDDDAFWAPHDDHRPTYGGAYDDWELDDPDATQPVPRIHRQPERTRTHHVVQRDAHRQALHDSDDILWLEPEYRRRRGAAPEAFGGVDPRALSLGAITLAAVLAVPLFHAITAGGGDAGSTDALRVVAAASTTTVPATAAPTTVIAVTADMSAPATTQTAIAGVRAGSRRTSADTSGAQSSNTAAPAQVATTAPPPPPCTNEYSAVAGDYWLRIADAVDVSLGKLLTLNQATAQTPLYPGSEVCLPPGAAAPAPPTTQPATTARPPPPPRRPRAAGHDGGTDDRPADDGRSDHRPADHRAGDDRAGDHSGRPTPATTRRWRDPASAGSAAERWPGRADDPRHLARRPRGPGPAHRLAREQLPARRHVEHRLLRRRVPAQLGLAPRVDGRPRDHLPQPALRRPHEHRSRLRPVPALRRLGAVDLADPAGQRRKAYQYAV